MISKNNLDKDFKIINPLDMIIDKQYDNSKIANRKRGLNIIKNIKKGDFNDYKKTRDCY